MEIRRRGNTSGATRGALDDPLARVYVYTQRSGPGLPALFKAIMALYAVIMLYLAVIGLWPALAIGAVGLALFSLVVYFVSQLAITIRVEGGTLHWSVTPLALSQSLPIASIVHAEAVRMSPFKPGFGVNGNRYVPGLGTVYGVHGRLAVKITPVGRAPFCLTTAEPDALVQAIEDARQHLSAER